MYISVIGTGYVGLVTGACFAEFGLNVLCMDRDESRIAMLEEGKVPFFEPGLAELVEKNIQAGRLRFTTDLNKAVDESLAIFIAVGTPSGPDGSADLSFVDEVARSVGARMTGYKVVITKSTVPVGTAVRVKKLIEESEKHGFWTLQAGIFSENKASINLHKKCGFRLVGIREKVGQLHGKWHDNHFLERRSKIINNNMKNIIIILFLLTANIILAQEDVTTAKFTESNITSLVYTVDSVEELNEIKWSDIKTMFDKNTNKNETIILGFKVKNDTKNSTSKFKHSFKVEGKLEDLEGTIKITKKVIKLLQKL